MAILSRVLHHNTEKLNEKPSLKHTLSSNGSLNSSKSNGTHHTVTLSIALESPPVILYGPPQDSSGSIISGLLKIDIKDTRSLKNLELSLVSSHSSITSSCSHSDEVDIESITLSLIQTVRYTKPFLIPSSSVASCKDCCTKKNVIAKWDVLISRSSFSVGTHAYPFSHLLPGSLPASSKLGSTYANSFIKYNLIATAKRPNILKEVKVILPLNIARLILRGPDRNSLRVFPPTEATASVILPNVIYPKSNFTLQLRLDNIVNMNNDRRWRMRKVVWRIEEHTKVKATTCKKHEPKLKQIEESQRKTEETKEIRLKSVPGGTHNPNTAHGPNKAANLHHSTIQTNMFISTCPSAQTNSSLHASNNIEGINGAPVVTEENAPVDEENDLTNTNENLIEEFLSPVQSTSNNDNNELSALPSGIAHGHNQNMFQDNYQNSRPESLEDTESLYLDEIRTTTYGEIKSGWKTDFSGRGNIELVTDIDAFDFSTGLNRHITKRSSDEPKIDEAQEGLRNGANISCDIDDPTLGIYVNHTLIVEAIVAEEVVPHSPDKKSNNIKHVSSSLSPVSSNSSAGKQKMNSTPNKQKKSPGVSQPGVATGAARVLRMQFKVTLTERSGLGIAWDDEVPPTYEDVRAFSPPTYAETSASATPVTTPASTVATPQLNATRSVSAEGLGGTPSQAFFNLGTRSTSNSLTIDGLVDLDERIQDLTI
ncbi:uncharacterized protein AC631_02398 [Debaryomyces fabryi]|uniref:LDB19 N-terminal domain-containing protein n=1 Tax=Debaryomyces fabryi TaxID=58627 RepID=A0A0V1Q071_9ASCO|nr:uncharacterized protein AC631_02398 [Debaryomyces fabryi]KSA01865.1 hypothetical protein AC631_02398 [Debaryomyces fabryi]CUM45621.1 unnamed protein product [Debaryomyces fabryi]